MANTLVRSALETLHVKPAEWDEWILKHEDYTPYHSAAWLQCVKETFGHPYYLLMIQQEGGCLLCPFVHVRSRLFGDRLVSVAYANYGGPIGKLDSESIEALLQHLSNLMRQIGVSVAEIRHRARMNEALPVRTHKVAYHLPLAEDAGVMWDTFPKKIRNWVRKGQRNGFVVRSGGEELVNDFYAAYSRNMRDLGSPVYPKNLFVKAIWSLPKTRVYAVYQGSTVVGGAVTICYQERVHIPWASVIKPYKPLGANFLLHWHIIHDAIQEGYRVLDFGQSNRGATTTHFKEQWGAQETPLYWEYVLLDGAQIPRTDHADPRYALFVSIWKRLPLRVANWLGPKIVRGIP